MDVQTWTTLSRLLDQALDLEPRDRTTWLDGLGAEYEAFKPRLRAMIERAASIGDSDFLATLPTLHGIVDDEDGAAAGPGTVVGRFRLERLIAEGGQGAVWLAEQVDGLIGRPVAIKLPHGLGSGPRLAERLSRERDILARLTHANIARVYDAGLTADGAPFLALEYVEGTTIDRHVAAARMDVRSTVRLFLQVVRAVAYAHGQLVIHRDLKPSNVMVTADGQVRLLDFGIARLLDETAVSNPTLTDAGRAMTLAYASPEQVARAPLGVATDVYSLGVILFELLSGERPFRPSRPSPAALEEAILTAPPPRPSDLIAGRTRRTDVRGDLDTIVLKALKKAPEDRYATAAALAEDLERHLEARPVMARPDSGWYRTGRFIRRNRVAVAAAAAIVAAILAGTGVAVWQMIRAGVERDQALLNQQRAEAFSEFMRVLLQDAGGGRRLTATELLDRGTDMLERQVNVDESVAAYMRYEISRHYLLFNQTDRELALLGRSAEGARRIGDANLAAAAECAAAWALFDRDRAEADARLESGERWLAAAPRVAGYSRADCLLARARSRQAAGDVAGATAMLEAELDAIDGAGDVHPSRRGLLMTQLSSLYRAADRYKDALRLSARELDEVRAAGRSGSLAELSALNNHASNLDRMGEAAAAGALLDQALEWTETTDLDIQPVGLRGNVGFSALRLGNARRALALADADRAVSAAAGNATNVARCDLLASRALLALGRADESLVRLRQAEATWEADRRMHARMFIEAALQRAELDMAAGRVDDARRLNDTTLSTLGYPERANAAGLDRVLRQGARIALRAGDAARSAQLASDALIASARLARDARLSADVGEALLVRAQARQALGLPAEARADVVTALDALSNGLGPASPLTISAASLARQLGAE